MAEGLALQVGEAEGVLLGEGEGVPEEEGVGLGLLPGFHQGGHCPCPSASL